MNIISIVGARPQIVKLGPLSREVRKNHNEIIIHTGQHYDKVMSEQIFHDLNIPKPDYNLKIHGGSHGKQTGQMLIHLEELILQLKPDLIIVFGDTNSTLAGTIVGAKLHIPIAHVEAGLRSFNRLMPEEINRIMTDHTSDLLFAPTKTALNNLAKEGLDEKSYLTGDIMVDALFENVNKATLSSSIVSKFNLSVNNYYLLTLHRPYNVDDPVRLELILSQLNKLNYQIIFPIHPRTEIILSKNDITVGENIKLIKPQGYLDFLTLMNSATKILTDSGGIQKEAYILKTPCITIRSETEWVETLNGGWNKLVNPLDDNFLIDVQLNHPTIDQKEVFGQNVAKTMVSLINDL